MKKMTLYTISTSGFEGSFMPVREKVQEEIKSMGLQYNGYDSTIFVQVPDATPTQNCLINMESADGFIILLNPRYGYIEKEKYDISVTHAEIEAVLKSKKPYIVLANDRLIKIADSVENADEFELDETNREFFDGDVESARKQIELIKSVMSRNVIGTYTDDSAEAIAELVRRQFSGLAPLFISQFINHQKETISKKAYRDAVGHVIRERVPVACKLSGVDEINPDVPIAEINRSLGRASVVFQGESGAGKSFSLKELLVEYSNTNNRGMWYAESDKLVPIYLDLSKYEKETFVFDDYVSIWNEEILALPWEIPSFVVEAIKKQGVLVFADNFEEWEYVADNELKRRLIGSFRGRFVLASTIASIVGFRESLPSNCDIYELLGWTEESLRQHALNCWSGKEAMVARLLQIIQTCEGRNRVAGTNGNTKHYSPFIYNMMIQSLTDATLDDIDIYANKGVGRLLRASMHNCIKKYAIVHRELTNGASVDDIARRAKELFMKVCMFMFEKTRTNGEQNSLAELQDYLYGSGVEYDTTLLRIFFNVGENKFYPKHMLIVYYYVAEEMTRSIMNEEFEIFSKYAIPSEVNRMIRDFLTDPNVPISKKAEIFRSALMYLYGLTDRVAKLRMYYFVPSFAFASRSFVKPVVEFLTDALSREKDVIHRVPIVIWLAQFGDVNGEKIFYESLCHDPQFNVCARGCHLVYQTDRSDKRIENFFDNDGKTEWSATAKSFMEHFNSNDPRHLYTRRTDLKLMIDFIKNGNKTVYPDFREFILGYDVERLWTMPCNEDVFANWSAQGLDVEQRKCELEKLFLELRELVK